MNPIEGKSNKVDFTCDPWASCHDLVFYVSEASRTDIVGSAQSLSRIRLFATPWTAAHQASLSITNSRNPSKPMSIELVRPSNHLIFCHPLLLLPSIFPSIRVFSKESALHIRWPKYWDFSFNISPSNEHPGLISFRMDWLAIKIFNSCPISPPASLLQPHWQTGHF